jgi:hypothetical protein
LLSNINKSSTDLEESSSLEYAVKELQMMNSKYIGMLRITILYEKFRTGASLE